MDLTPLDIWKLISLYLDFNQLALNKIFKSIYDDDWFKIMVLSKYPNFDNKYNESWKELYKRSLKPLVILTYKSIMAFEPIKNDIEGLKVISTNGMYGMTLTFDGDLYCCYIKYDKWINILIDVNVRDILHGTYIKENTWYNIIYHSDRGNVTFDKESVTEMINPV